MAKLQDTINKLVKYILDYKSREWTSHAHNLTREQAENIAAALITDLVTEEIDGSDIRDFRNALYPDLMPDTISNKERDKLIPSKMEEYKNQMENLLDEMQRLTNELPYKGDKCEDSQKVCLLSAIKKVSIFLNGLELGDFHQE